MLHMSDFLVKTTIFQQNNDGNGNGEQGAAASAKSNGMFHNNPNGSLESTSRSVSNQTTGSTADSPGKTEIDKHHRILREQQQDRTAALLELIYSRLDRIDSESQRQIASLQQAQTHAHATSPAAEALLASVGKVAHMEKQLGNIGQHVSEIKHRLFARPFSEARTTVGLQESMRDDAAGKSISQKQCERDRSLDS
jgi:hypothetical protein